MEDKPLNPSDIEAGQGDTIYPEPYRETVKGRFKRKLGDHFGLTNFGVNLTTLEPGSASALRHSHRTQDEFVYILEGRGTLALGDERLAISAGQCVGFKAGTGVPHHILNDSGSPLVCLEVGDRTPGDRVEYPDADLAIEMDADGNWKVMRKDGSLY